MHVIKLTIALSILPIICHAEALSDANREALIKRIQEIEKESSSFVNQKNRNAMTTFSTAMASDKAALELYLKCEELVNFEQKKKKNVEFREWKKTNEAKFSDPAFSKNLQLQLQWLSLTLKASSKDADREKLSLEASAFIDRMVENAEDLKPHQSILSQSVKSSVFAQAYNISEIEVEAWPFSPSPISAVYEQIILPPLRRISRIEALKSSWQKRINQEGDLTDTWSSEKPRGSLNTRSAAYDNFILKTLPDLRWNAEVDIYKAGDELGAATKMIKHIEANISHKSATGWVEQFNDLVQAASKIEQPMRNKETETNQ